MAWNRPIVISESKLYKCIHELQEYKEALPNEAQFILKKHDAKIQIILLESILQNKNIDKVLDGIMIKKKKVLLVQQAAKSNNEGT